jgi:hypothetical protein
VNDPQQFGDLIHIVAEADKSYGVRWFGIKYRV